MSGLRERKKVETKAALSWAAISLTVERGFDNVRVEDIAAAAGVSPRTFNNYFASKAEAIVSRHLDRGVRVAHLLRGRPAGEPLWTAITAAVLAEFEPGPEVQAMPVADQSAWLEGLKVMVAEPALQGELMRVAMVAEQEIAAAVAERTGTDLRRDMYPALVAAAVTAASNVAVKHYLTADPVVGMEVLLPAALAQFAAGLPVPEATTLPPGADASGLPAGVDASGLPAGVDASGLPAGVDASGLPAGVDASGLPAGADASGLPGGADASGLPAGLSAQAADLPAFRAAAQGVGPPAG